MDKIIANFTGTEGRISRQAYWIGAIILFVIQIALSLLVFPLIGLGPTTTMGMWASVVLFLIFAYPIYALMVKRRHDRDNNGLDALIFLVVLFIFTLLPALGMGYTLVEVNGTAMLAPSMILSVASIVVLIYAIYMLVVLGFLKGTAGPNQYGPDPLGGA